MQKKDYFTKSQVVMFPDVAVALGGIISADATNVTKNDRKLVKAGTPVGGADFMKDSQTVLTTADANNVQGVLVHDVDVTDGNGNGTVLINGYINTKYVDKSVTIADDVQKALDGKITFINR